MKRAFFVSLQAVLLTVAIGTVATTQGGCSGSPGDPAPSQQVASSVVASLGATEQTTQKTGIVRWEFNNESGGFRHIDGVDASGALVLSLSMVASTDTVTVDGVQKQLKVITIETSRGGAIRVAEGGKLLSMAPDPVGFGVFQNDVVPLTSSHPELTEFNCSWFGAALCYATCIACGAAPEFGVDCLACFACAADCIL